MNFTLKSEKFNKKTVSIVLDKLNASENENDIKALLILLGGYNSYGRKLPLETHRENMAKFKDLIDSISENL
jgi:hypothetical protein